MQTTELRTDLPPQETVNKVVKAIKAAEPRMDVTVKPYSRTEYNVHGFYGDKQVSVHIKEGRIGETKVQISSYLENPNFIARVTEYTDRLLNPPLEPPLRG